MDYWITVLNQVHKVTDVKARHARPIISKAIQFKPDYYNNNNVSYFTKLSQSVWIQSSSNQFELVLTLHVENWRTNLDNTEQESTNYKEPDLFTAYIYN